MPVLIGKMSSQETVRKQELEPNHMSVLKLHAGDDAQAENQDYQKLLSLAMHGWDVSIPNKAVYVSVIDGEEHLSYDPQRMEKGKIYSVLWNGQLYGVCRGKSGIELLRLDEDERN